MSLKGLYAITDEHLTPHSSILQQVQEALHAGVSIVQYRNKNVSDEKAEPVCRGLQALCREYNALFIIDDRAELAQRIGADGLHIGKEDIPLKRARELFPKGIIGVSCYGSVIKALKAQEEDADYVAFGSFFPSPTKPHSGVVSLEVLKEAKKQLRIPICAIGGINAANIHQVAACRPDMISLVSAIFEGNVAHNVTQLKQGMKL
ncbi:MAG: thiamine phosphate synthase [Campylobacterales bacterium]|nr:thiamine phosphate synthase [Campylobacterales bacterium]